MYSSVLQGSGDSGKQRMESRSCFLGMDYDQADHVKCPIQFIQTKISLLCLCQQTFLKPQRGMCFNESLPCSSDHTVHLTIGYHYIQWNIHYKSSIQTLLYSIVPKMDFDKDMAQPKRKVSFNQPLITRLHLRRL